MSAVSPGSSEANTRSWVAPVAVSAVLLKVTVALVMMPPWFWVTV
jgi:hypothetical protein